MPDKNIKKIFENLFMVVAFFWGWLVKGKYGKYIGAAADEGHVLVLNPNGACTYNGASCTYSIGTHDFAQDESTRGSYETCLIIKADYTHYLMPYTNTSIGDGDIGEFNYAG